MLNRALFSSVKDDWPTPWEFFHNLNLEFNFTLDVCAVPWSAKVWRYCVPPHALRVWGESLKNLVTIAHFPYFRHFSKVSRRSDSGLL